MSDADIFAHAADLASYRGDVELTHKYDSWHNDALIELRMCPDLTRPHCMCHRCTLWGPRLQEAKEYLE